MITNTYKGGKIFVLWIRSNPDEQIKNKYYPLVAAGCWHEQGTI